MPEAYYSPHPAKKQMAELDLSDGLLVVRSGSSVERIAVNAGTIDIVPAWRFLLDMAE